MKGVLSIVFLTLSVVFAGAQMRPVDEGPRPAPRKPAAPETFEARYEGGMIGFSRKEKGKLRFDETNRRLIFLGKDGKERFSLAYELMNAIYPQSQ